MVSVWHSPVRHEDMQQPHRFFSGPWLYYSALNNSLGDSLPDFCKRGTIKLNVLLVSTRPSSRVSSPTAPLLRAMESGPSTLIDATPIPPGLSNHTQMPTPIATAIANFKPSPREIISGIAPHIFDERRKRRRRSVRSSRPLHRYDKGSRNSSPLRCSAVIAWDNGSMMILESDHHSKVKEPTLNDRQHVHVPVQQSLFDHTPKPDNSDTPAWRSTLRTIVVKLRPSKRRKH